MTDIVTRLRARKEPTIEVDMHYPQIVDSDEPDAECAEAAVKIERLRAALRAVDDEHGYGLPPETRKMIHTALKEDGK